MLQEELIELVDKIVYEKCEKQNLEIKKAGKGTPERLYDTMSAFSNQTNGGIIIFGIDEKNDYEVTGVYDAQDLQVKVTNYAMQMQPVVRPLFTVCEYYGKIIVSAEIPECDITEKPCFYKGAGRLRGSYIRVGEADMPMTEYEVYNFETYKKKIRDELRTVDGAKINDLSRERLAEFFIKIKKEKTQLSKLDEENILRLQGITADGSPTVGGLLILSDYPQGFYPQLGITAMVVDGYELGAIGTQNERFIDNKRINGTIPEMLDEALGFVRRNIRTSTVINDNGQRADIPEYPIVAVREIILNALIHRDYSRFTEDSPIRILIFKNRIEVENPGGLYGRLTLNDLGKVPGDTRNAFLADNLETLINTENRFSGIPTIYSEMKNAGLMPPKFEVYRGNFKAVLFNQRAMVESIDDGDKQSEILKYCTTPRSRSDIANYLGVKSTYYVVQNYLNPMIEEGKLKLLLPDKPKSKKQRYQTSDL